MDHVSFEKAILDNPESDDLRLAYAEWLERRGDPRGEFIRVQVELRRLRRRQDPPERWFPLLDRAEELEQRHGREWAGPVARRVAAWKLRGGFVEEITLGAAQFLERAEELFRLAPIRHLVVTDAAPVMERLCASPHLSRMVSLSLAGNGIDDAGVRLLAGSPHVHRLAWLDLSNNDIGLPGLEALFTTDRLPSLRFLGFARNRAEDPTGSPTGIDDTVVHDCYIPPLGEELQQRYGERPWIAWWVRHIVYWPPDKDDV